MIDLLVAVGGVVLTFALGLAVLVGLLAALAVGVICFVEMLASFAGSNRSGDRMKKSLPWCFLGGAGGLGGAVLASAGLWVLGAIA